MGQTLKALIAELRRRNVFRVAGTYAVVSWIMVQIAAITTSSFGAPDWVMKMLIVTFAIGFPIAVIFAWAFEMTPEGVRPTEQIPAEDSISAHTGRKLDWAILIGLLVVGILMVTGPFMSRSAPLPTLNIDAANELDVVSSDELSTGSVSAERKLQMPTPSGNQSIAVLPFDDFSPDKDQDYFAKGISEELLNVLTRIEGLRVASRTSAFAFQDQDKSVSEIAQALNVAHILEGSIRKAGSTLRISTQLINTANDQPIWSETYDRPLSAQNIFDVQDEIAAAIVNELKGRLSFKPEGSAGRTVSLEAYELYLKAIEKANQRLPGPLNEAIEIFEQVITLDPNYSQAYSGLADAYMFSFVYGGQNRDTTRAQALKNIDRALSLSPASAEALSSKSMYAHMFRTGSDVTDSIKFAEEAIKANPNYSIAYHRLGHAYATQGNYEESLKAFEKAREFDPLSSSILSSLARIQNLIGDWKAAKATSLDNRRWNPNQPTGYIYLSYFNFMQGNYVEAHSLAKDAQALNPAYPANAVILQQVYLKARMFEEASKIVVNEDVQPYAGTNSYAKAIIAIEKGELDNIATLISDIEDDNIKDFEDTKKAAIAHYFTGNYTEALPLFEKAIAGLGLDKDEANIDNLVFMTQALAVFEQENHPSRSLYQDKLNRYFGTRSYIDFERQDELSAGAMRLAMSDTPEKALSWIKRMIELGQADMTLKEPAFDSLRRNAQFRDLEIKMNENRDALKAELQKQRANPKENWLPFD